MSALMRHVLNLKLDTDVFSLRVFASAVSIASSVMVSTPAAADWSEISEADSKIYLRTEGPKTYLSTGWDADYSGRSFLVQMKADSGYNPRSEIVYKELAPGYFFKWIKNPADLLKTFNYLKSGARVTGTTQRFADSYAFDWVTLEKDERACFAFVSTQGQGGGDGQTSAGTSYIAGYYCNRVKVPITPEDASVVLGAIGTKDSGTRMPGPTVSVAGSIAAPKPTSQPLVKAPAVGATPVKPAASAASGEKDALERKLARAKSLFEKGLIDQQDYENLKQQILKEF